MIVDDLIIRDPLILAVDKAMEFMKKNMRLGYGFTGELKRKETWQYPVTVLRELLLNAIIHKDYRDPTDVIIKMFDEHIEFTNSGKPVHIVCGLNENSLVIITVYIPGPPKFKNPYERG